MEILVEEVQAEEVLETVLVEEVQAEEVLEILVEEVLETVLVEEVLIEENQLKNIKQLVQNVVRNAKFHSNQHPESQFIALNVSKKKIQDLDLEEIR